MYEFEQVYRPFWTAKWGPIPDKVAGSLPFVPKSHPAQLAWARRAFAYERLANLIRLTAGHVRILDLGCGNGWMAARLATVPKVEVWAVDIAQFQIAQAQRLFGGKSNLHFLRADIFRDSLPQSEFEMIILMGAAQFFPDLGALFGQLREILSPKGKIYLLGEAFYFLRRIEAEKARLYAEFDALGVPEMRNFYHFHSVEELAVLGARCLYDPFPETRGWMSNLRRSGRETHYWFSMRRA